MKRRKEKNMSVTLPLPLQLAQPTEMASSLEDVLKESFQVVNMKYNPETQVRETPEGVPMVYNGGSGTSCSNETKSWDHGIVIDLKLDIQVDDVLG
jgi:hypothetical protein